MMATSSLASKQGAGRISWILPESLPDVERLGRLVRLEGVATDAAVGRLRGSTIQPEWLS